MFTQRGPNEVKFYSGGQIVRHTVTNDDRVILRSGDQRILVRDVRVLATDRFSGTIYGFEPSFATEFNGMQLEQDVQFGESQIFGFGA